MFIGIKMYLALNTLQWLICYKSKTNKQTNRRKDKQQSTQKINEHVDTKGNSINLLRMQRI